MMYVIVCDVDEVYVDDLGDVKDSKLFCKKKTVEFGSSS